MSSRRNRLLTVKHKMAVTPNMVRIILAGSELYDFPEGQESGYVKLLLPTEYKTLKRSYTIRAFDAEAQELTLDFVVHGDLGPASAWASNARPGDSIEIDGPGPNKLLEPSADWVFLAGDMTALPAISVNLEKLPESARGYAVVEIIDEQDKQTIRIPSNMELHWVINPRPDQPNKILVNKVKSLSWLEGMVNIWVASEFEAMRSIRHYFTQEHGVERRQIYASSYWKMGETDEGNKAAKKLDADAV